MKNIRQYDNNSLNYTSLWKLKKLVENKSQFKAMRVRCNFHDRSLMLNTEFHF